MIEGMSSFASDEQFVGLIRQEQTGTSLQDQVSRLFEEARDDVYRYLLTLGLYPPQAQEATQEVFLRLYATLRKGEEIQNPRAWIFRVAHNLGLKIRAAAAFRGALQPRSRAPPTATQTETPESELLERERMTRFHAAVAGPERAAAALPVSAHGRPALSGDRRHAGNQRQRRRGISAPRHGAAQEGAR